MGVTPQIEGDGYDIDESYRLEWTSRPGAWVRCRAVSTGEMIAISEKLAAATDEQGRTDKIVMMKHAAQTIADVALEWSFVCTVKDPASGQVHRVPLECTYDGAMRLGYLLLLDIYKGIMQEGATVESSSPLDEDSPSGLSFPEELTTMETLSPNQLS